MQCLQSDTQKCRKFGATTKHSLVLGSAHIKKRSNTHTIEQSRQGTKHKTNKDRDNKDTQHSVDNKRAFLVRITVGKIRKLLCFPLSWSLTKVPLVSSEVCYYGNEPDPSHGNKLRWVLPVRDPCRCTVIRIGGMNSVTPKRAFQPKYEDQPFTTKDVTEIRKKFNCSGKLQKGRYLGKTLKNT